MCVFYQFPSPVDGHRSQELDSLLHNPGVYMLQNTMAREGEKWKNRNDFFLLIYGTLLLIINVTFHDPLRGNWLLGKKYKN